jgi:5-amino-6-(5-phosphoribosylamino)uracil reductase
MRQLLPVASDDVDPGDLYPSDARPAPPDRPWLMLNMITSIDGATATSGRSGGLGTPADRAIFMILRSLADIIVVAAGTVRDEHYGPVTLSDQLQERRRDRGQSPLPRLAIVSRRLDIDRHGPLFARGVDPPIVVTSPGADQARRTELTAAGADLVLAGTGPDVDLRAALHTLGEMGASVVLCEGGPTFNGALLAADLIDEVCLTIAPRLVGGESARVAHGVDRSDLDRLALRRVLEDDGALFLRYTRT